METVDYLPMLNTVPAFLLYSFVFLRVRCGRLSRGLHDTPVDICRSGGFW